MGAAGPAGRSAQNEREGVPENTSCCFRLRDDRLPRVVTLGFSGRFPPIEGTRGWYALGPGCRSLLGLPVQGIEILGAGIVEKQQVIRRGESERSAVAARGRKVLEIDHLLNGVIANPNTYHGI